MKLTYAPKYNIFFINDELIMKILISTPQFLPVITGITFRVQMMTDHFIKHGHQVVIVTPNKLSVSEYKNSKVHILPSKKINKLYSGGKYNELYQYHYGKIKSQLHKICKDEQIDIIHICGPEPGCQEFIEVANLLKIAVVLSYNTEAVEFMSKATKLPLFFSLIFNKLAQFLGATYCIPLKLRDQLQKTPSDYKYNVTLHNNNSFNY